METIKKYHEIFQVDWKIIEFEKKNQRIIFDKKKVFTLNKLKPTLIFDIDHNLLKVTPDLKREFNQSISEFDPSLFPNKWTETYSEAKTAENYYDYKKHCIILAEFIKNNNSLDENSSELEKILFNTLDKIVPELVFENLLKFLKSNSAKCNLILASSGSGAFQQRKIAALIPMLPIIPELIIYIENLYKGQAIIELKKLFSNLKKIVIFDDNVDELQDIYNKSNKECLLIRIKQKQGIYNIKKQSIFSQNFIEIDFENDSFAEEKLKNLPVY